MTTFGLVLVVLGGLLIYWSIDEQSTAVAESPDVPDNRRAPRPDDPGRNTG